MDGAEPFSRRGLRFGSSVPILHLYSDASTLGWGERLFDRSRVHGVFGARDVVPHLSFRIEGVVLALPSFPVGVTVLRVKTRRLWLPSIWGAGQYPASSAS